MSNIVLTFHPPRMQVTFELNALSGKGSSSLLAIFLHHAVSLIKLSTQPKKAYRVEYWLFCGTETGDEKISEFAE